MVRKSSIYILFIFLLVLIPGQLFSLGLGDIEVNSALNQPLNAQINLIAAREDEFEEMRVELAPANVFDRVGVPRPYFLTKLKFQPVMLPGGGTAIRVTSKDPVREPFLTFLVEVTWPKGRLLREYTVLLDPPEFAQQQAPQIATPVTTPVEQAPVEESVVETQPVVSSQPDNVVVAEDLEKIREEMDRQLGIDDSVVAEEVAPVVTEAEEVDVVETEVIEAEVIDVEPSVEEIEEEVTETVVETQLDEVVDTEDLEKIREEMDRQLGIDDSVVAEEVPAETIEAEVVTESETTTQSISSSEVVVTRGDTLYRIAESASQGQTSVNQMMLAIQQANPNAFIKNNVNLLKKGAVLRIPSAAEASVMPRVDARKEIAQQNALWREYRGKVAQTPAANVDAPALVKENQTDKAKAAEQALKETAKKAESKQELNILAADKAGESSNVQVAGGEEIKKLQKEINLANEQALSKSKEAEELKSRIQELESMLEKKEKILNIQSQQLKDLKDQLSLESQKAAEVEQSLKEKAALEAELKAQQAAQKAAEEAKLKAEEEAKKAAEAALAKAKLEAEKAKQAAKKLADAETQKPVVEPLPEFKDEPALAEENVGTPRLEPLPDWDALPEIKMAPEQVAEATPEEKPTETESKPEIKPEQPAEVATADAGKGMLGTVLGLLDKFKTQLQVGTGVLAVVLGGIWFWRRKQVKTIELTGLGEMPMDGIEDGDNFDDILDETIVTPQAQAVHEEVGAMDNFDAAESAFEEPAFASDDAESGEDVLDEADVYISYGLHQQAQDLLNDAIAKEPGRNDYKAKLAEVYYSQKDQSGFEQYAEKIKGDLGETSSEWQKIMSMGKELAPASALFAGAAAVAATSSLDKPEEADIDLGIQAPESEAASDVGLEDTVLDNDAGTDDGGLDFNIDDPVDEIEDDPVASKIMEANETSDILNFDVDDLADDLMDDDQDVDRELDAIATGLHETASMDDLTEELENIGMQTTMNDLKQLDIDEDDIDISDDAAEDTVAMTADDMGVDTGISEPDPEATAAYTSSSLNDALNETEQFDASNMDTEFLDPAEQTVAQTHTDLEELGPPSLIEEVGTKLDLAKAFVDMGDADAAKETLLEVINEGDESQIKAAKDLMDKLGG